VSRLVGISTVGIVAGLAIGMLEQVAKSGWLKVTGGLITGKQFILYINPTRIGSSPDCEIYLFKDPTINPRHAAIRTVPGGFEIEDLQSAGGTYVNGQAIRRQRLRSGDQLQIGATTFQFHEKNRQ
jgi:pSer/pThr/pTyr-binding forkhead associated (FHA) protein